MASPFLAGLGQGLQTFASLQHQSNLERQAKAERDAQTQREIAQDALRKALTEAQIAALGRKDEPKAPTFKIVRGKDGAYHAINESTGLDPQGQPVQGWDEPQTPVKPPAPVQVSPGSSLVDPITGRRLYHEPDRPPGAGAAPRPLTEDQAKSTGYYGRAMDAENVLSGSHRSLTGAALQGAKDMKFIGGMVGPVANIMMSPEQQKFENAADAFLAAVLRRESGAAISATERSEYRKIYIPAVGDSEEVLAQKAKNRATAIAALKTGSGAGAATMTGTGSGITADERAALKAQGYSDEELDALR